MCIVGGYLEDIRTCMNAITCPRVCMNACARACVYIRACVYVCVRARARVCAPVCARPCVRACAHLCECECVYVCVHAYMFACICVYDSTTSIWLRPSSISIVRPVSILRSKQTASSIKLTYKPAQCSPYFRSYP